MTKYILRKDKTKEKIWTRKIEEIEKKASTDYAGNEIFKQVEIIRMLAEVMERKGGDSKGLLCYKWEEPIANEPILKVHVLPDKYV